MEEITLDFNAVKKEATDLERKAAELPAEVRNRIPEITNDEDLGRANKALAYIKSVRQSVEDYFDPLVIATRKAWKMALGKKQDVERPLDEAESFVKGSIKAYSLKLAREREEAEDKEKKRLAEIARMAEERVQEAIKAEEAGDKERADEILQEAVVQVEEETKAAPIITQAPKMEAAIMRDHWVWREVDPILVPREFLMLDRVKITTLVTRMKDKAVIPGIEVFNDPIVSHRGERR